MKYSIIFLMVVIMMGCKKEVGEISFWQVDDVTKSESRISVQIEEEPGVLNVYVKGETDGTFQVVANGQGDNKTYEFKGGVIDTVLSDFWKSAVCRTVYVPKSVKNGTLQISTLIYPKE